MKKLTYKGFLLGTATLLVSSMAANAEPLVAAQEVLPQATQGESQAQVIQELKRQLMSLQQQVNTLTTKTETAATANREMYRSIRRVERAATPSKMVSSGKSNVSLSLSGQVNKAVLFVDDETDSDTFFVDNDNSSTRIRFIAKGKINEDLTLGSLIEVQHESNTSGSGGPNIQNNGNTGVGTSNVSFTERKAEVTLTSKSMGKIFLGQGDPASNGTAEVDLSGTSIVAYSGLADMAGGQVFRTSAGAFSSKKVGGVWNQFDGQSRTDRIRYDTPSFAGFKAGVTSIQGGGWDTSLKYSGKFSGTKVSAAIAYLDQSSNGDKDNQIDGSISVLHSSGVSLTFSSGTSSTDTPSTGDDPFSYYVKLGYTGNWFSLGSTSVSIDFAEADDIDSDGDEFRTYAFAVVQDVKKLGASFYLAVRQHELDSPTQNFDDIIAVMVGSRVKF